MTTSETYIGGGNQSVSNGTRSTNTVRIRAAERPGSRLVGHASEHTTNSGLRVGAIVSSVQGVGAVGADVGSGNASKGFGFGVTGRNEISLRGVAAGKNTTFGFRVASFGITLGDIGGDEDVDGVGCHFDGAQVALGFDESGYRCDLEVDGGSERECTSTSTFEVVPSSHCIPPLEDATMGKKESTDDHVQQS